MSTSSEVQAAESSAETTASSKSKIGGGAVAGVDIGVVALVIFLTAASFL